MSEIKQVLLRVIESVICNEVPNRIAGCIKNAENDQIAELIASAFLLGYANTPPEGD